MLCSVLYSVSFLADLHIALSGQFHVEFNRTVTCKQCVSMCIHESWDGYVLRTVNYSLEGNLVIRHPERYLFVGAESSNPSLSIDSHRAPFERMHFVTVSHSQVWLLRTSYLQ